MKIQLDSIGREWCNGLYVGAFVKHKIKNNPNKVSGVPAFSIANYTSLHRARNMLFDNLFQLWFAAGMTFKGKLSYTAGCQTHSFHIKQICHSVLQNTKTDQSTMNGHNTLKYIKTSIAATHCMCPSFFCFVLATKSCELVLLFFMLLQQPN